MEISFTNIQNIYLISACNISMGIKFLHIVVLNPAGFVLIKVKINEHFIICGILDL